MAAKKGSKPGPRVDPVLTGVLPAGAIAMPPKPNNRGSKSNYPFAELTAVGMSFGIVNKTPEQMAAIIANQNRKPGPQKKDTAGNPMFKMQDMLGADGKPNGTQVATNEPIYAEGPQFFVVAPGEDDPANIDPNTKKPLPADKRIKSRVFRAS